MTRISHAEVGRFLAELEKVDDNVKAAWVYQNDDSFAAHPEVDRIGFFFRGRRRRGVRRRSVGAFRWSSLYVVSGVRGAENDDDDHHPHHHHR